MRIPSLRPINRSLGAYPAAGLVLGLVVAACGGSSGSTPAAATQPAASQPDVTQPTPTPASTPTATPSPTEAPAASLVALTPLWQQSGPVTDKTSTVGIRHRSGHGQPLGRGPVREPLLDHLAQGEVSGVMGSGWHRAGAVRLQRSLARTRMAGARSPSRPMVASTSATPATIGSRRSTRSVGSSDSGEPSGPMTASSSRSTA